MQEIDSTLLPYLSLSAADTTCDSTMDPSQDQYIVWGVGGLGETAFKHFIRAECELCDVCVRLIEVSKYCSNNNYLTCLMLPEHTYQCFYFKIG